MPSRLPSLALSALRRLSHPDPEFRHAQRWYTQIGRRVWFFELWNFLFRDRRLEQGPTLQEHWKAASRMNEESMVVERRKGTPAIRPLAIAAP
jgi:anaerobic magnesium-protoporphyrin IX monomethyl ester cyclase